MDASAILEVDRLSVTLDGVSILTDISFAIKEGEALAVIGPNGAGKTVLFRALLGLIRHEGRVQWRPGVRIGYVPQKFSVERSTPLTAQEFFLLHSPNFWRPSQQFLRDVEAEIARMGMDKDILRKKVGELSGGETQRLLIAWALLQRPDVLLLDEPTAGVDVSFEETVYALIRRIQTERHRTILLISHDLSIVYSYVQNVICLNRTVVCQGPPVEVLTPQALAALFGAAGFYPHAEHRH